MSRLAETGKPAVISVAEVWLAPENLRQQWKAENPDSHYLNEINRKYDEKSKKMIAEFETLANHAATRLRRMFPGWTVSAEAASGSPAWEVLTKADNFKPDLIVAGSQGRSAVGRFFLGSIGENSPEIRAKISENLSWIGIEVDSKLNKEFLNGREGIISTEAARLKVYVIPTNEELLIARDTVRLVGKSHSGS